MRSFLTLEPEFEELMKAFVRAKVDFIIVGAHAVSAHAAARSTGDFDVFVNPTPWNAKRVMVGLRAFDAPIEAHGVKEADFARPGIVYMGVPPLRIDVLAQIEAVSFDEAKASCVWGAVSGMALPFLGMEALLRNKRAVGRPKDLIDVERLEAARRR